MQRHARMVALVWLALMAAPNWEDLRFAYADQLWSEGRVSEAAEQYRAMARELNGRSAKSAAHFWILARQELLEADVPHRFDGSPWPLDVERQALVEAIDFYAANYPDDSEAETGVWQVTRLYIDAHDFVKAEQRVMWLFFHGKDGAMARELLAEIEAQRSRTPEVGEPQTIGTPQTVGEPQTVGGPEDAWEPQEDGEPQEDVGEDLGGPTAEDVEGEGEEYVVP